MLKTAEGVGLTLSALTTKGEEEQSGWKKIFQGDGYVYNTNGGDGFMYVCLSLNTTIGIH